MKNIGFPLNQKRLTALTILFALCMGMFVIGNSTPVLAKETNIETTARKASSEFNKFPGDYQADAILQLNGPMSTALADFIKKNLALKESFSNLDAYAIKLKVSFLPALTAFPEVSFVALDKEVKKLGHVTKTTGAEAAWAMGHPTPYNGANVAIAVLDSGIDTTHKSFLDGRTIKVTFSKDFTGEALTSDPYGHGSHVASAAVGDPSILSGAYTGIAPKARVVNLRVLNSLGVGTVTTVLRALDWLMVNRSTYKIRVVNMSLGAIAVDSYKKDPLCRAVRRLVQTGTVVVAAAGNNGKDADGNKIYGAIHTPGIEPTAITVGATNTFGTDSRSDDVVTTYSSRGPTRTSYVDENNVVQYDNVIKPNLVAPGNKLIQAQAKRNYIVTNNPNLAVNSREADMMYLSGTSMAAPVVSGAVALMLHANPKLTPNLVKTILEYTAQPLSGYSIVEQGAGQLNVEGAVRLAELIRTDLSSSTPVGDPLLVRNADFPLQATTLGTETFNWSQRILMDPTYTATGSSLISKYQRVYDQGILMTDGILISDGIMMADGIMMTDGIMMADGILMTDGILMADGIMMNDGIMMTDGILMADGIMMNDSTNGDGTASMR